MDNVYPNISESIIIKIFFDNVYLFYETLEGIFECQGYIVYTLFGAPSIKGKLHFFSLKSYFGILGFFGLLMGFCL